MTGTEIHPPIVKDGVPRVSTDDPDRIDAFLPTSTVQCHAANLLPLPDGALGCAWFGGTQEGLSDICIWFARLDDEGTWSRPVQVTDDPGCSEQNPVLFSAGRQELWLLYTAQHAGAQDSAEVRVRVSHDDGRSWSDGRTLLPAGEGAGVFIRHPVVVLDDGRWLLPVFHCVRPAEGPWVGDEDTSAVMVSADRGATWSHHPVPHSTGCVHMNVLALADGSLLALFRRRQADAIHRSHSTDGVTWSRPVPTDLPNNNSSIQATTLHDGRLVLAFNPSNAGDATQRRWSLYDEIDGHAGEQPSSAETSPGQAFWGAPRAPMTLAMSYDNGLSWPVRRNVEVGDGYCITNNSQDGLNRELSYPSVVQSPDRRLHLAFTYFRQAIKHVSVAPSWVEGKGPSPVAPDERTGRSRAGDGPAGSNYSLE